MEFESLLHFAEHLIDAVDVEVTALEKGMARCAWLVEKSAKAEIGHYQPQRGPFQDWAELADSTKEDRVRQGYPENEPLFRSGELRDSIESESSLTEAIIGSTSPIMAYQEFGTNKIPPRPVIGPAAFKNKARIQKIIGAAAISGLFDGEPIHESLGYEMETDK